MVRPRIPRTLARSAGAVLVPKFTWFPLVTLRSMTLTRSRRDPSPSPLPALQPLIRQAGRHLLLRPPPMPLTSSTHHRRLQKTAHATRPGIRPAHTPRPPACTRESRQCANTGHAVTHSRAASRHRASTASSGSHSPRGSHNPGSPKHGALCAPSGADAGNPRPDTRRPYLATLCRYCRRAFSRFASRHGSHGCSPAVM